MEDSLLHNRKRDRDALAEARAALAKGENFRAYDLAESAPDGPEGPSPWKTFVMSLALARSGSIQRARELTASLPEECDSAFMDSEFSGQKSRLYKDQALSEANPLERRALFTTAADISEGAFRRSPNYYNGINAASCRFLAGDRDKARRFVRDELLPLCESEKTCDLWLVATLAECRLLIGDFVMAATLYGEAMDLATSGRRLGDFASTLRQLRLLADEIGPDAQTIAKNLPLPCVAVFSGHMIDAPGRATPRFPPSAEEGVRLRLRAAIRDRRVAYGYASCACGGDILFLEEVLAAGGRVVVAPPLPLKKTIRGSVAFAPGNWEARLRAILTNPCSTLLDAECDESGEDDDLAYDFCNRYLFGLASLKARETSYPLRGICVWNGVESGLPGGTDSAVGLWRAAGVELDTIAPMEGV
ncbi:MAG: hypothetical protein IJQ73_03560 [Kiritimatiellae bacterium]|nr:hypothetical protein [Kiritimatiellia bacterium]